MRLLINVLVMVSVIAGLLAAAFPVAAASPMAPFIMRAQWDAGDLTAYFGTYGPAGTEGTYELKAYGPHGESSVINRGSFLIAGERWFKSYTAGFRSFEPRYLNLTVRDQNGTQASITSNVVKVNNQLHSSIRNIDCLTGITVSVYQDPGILVKFDNITVFEDWVSDVPWSESWTYSPGRATEHPELMDGFEVSVSLWDNKADWNARENPVRIDRMEVSEEDVLACFPTNPPSGTASCTGGSISNPNPFDVSVVYTVDGEEKFNGSVAANSTQSVDYVFTDIAFHSSEFSWSGNGKSGEVDLGQFGPCADIVCQSLDAVFDEETDIVKLTMVGTPGANGSIDRTAPEQESLFADIMPEGGTVVVTDSVTLRDVQYTYVGKVGQSLCPASVLVPEQPLLEGQILADCESAWVSPESENPSDVVAYVRWSWEAPETRHLVDIDNVAHPTGKARVNKTEYLYVYSVEDVLVDTIKVGVCRTKDKFERGQYEDKRGAVLFTGMPYVPEREVGKEYFPGTQAIAANIEYLGEIPELVFRFNGAEVGPDVVTSVFHGDGSFEQTSAIKTNDNAHDDTGKLVDSERWRTPIPSVAGISKYITYRFGEEQSRIFHQITNDPNDQRWMHPLTLPFERDFDPSNGDEYDFVLELYGPVGTTDVVLYGTEKYEITYGVTGTTTLKLHYSQAGLVEVFDRDMSWTTGLSHQLDITSTEVVTHAFGEVGLSAYRLIDGEGNVLVEESNQTTVTWTGKPAQVYIEQFRYPLTSMFVSIIDDMQFQHADQWEMPIDGREEIAEEWHMTYHRDADNNVVVENLYKEFAAEKVTDGPQYGRHDGVQTGVNIVGIPTVNMIAYCQRPGVHEVVYWGGWEAESWWEPFPSTGVRIFDEELYDLWSEEDRNDCIDAAYRVNMELAREGLRTDHTFAFHGEHSQGYQMTRGRNDQGLGAIWSPYNIYGLRAPHVASIIKPGVVLGHQALKLSADGTTYEPDPEDLLFWGWDLAKGNLKDGIGLAELQQHLDELGAPQFIDHTVAQ